MKTKKRINYIGNKFKFYALPIVGNKFVLETFVVFFPKELFNQAKLWKKTNKMEFSKKNERLAELNQFLRMIDNQILYLSHINEKTIDDPWIITNHEMNLDAIEILLNAWVKSYYPKLSEQHFFQLEQREQKITIKIEERNNGSPAFTCDYKNLNAYTILNNYFISKLNELQIPINYDNTTKYIKFEKAIGDNGYPELISWPPEGIEVAPWSYRLKLNIETIPFEKKPYLIIESSIIRWAKNLYTRDDNNLKPYLRLPKNIQLGGKNPIFVKFEFNNRRWSPFIMKLLEELGLAKLLPTVNDFRKNPLKWLHSSDEDITIGVPYGSHLIEKHFASSGVSPIERNQFAIALKNTLVELFPATIGDFILLEQQGGTIPIKALTDVQLPEELLIECFYQHEEFLDVLKRKIVENVKFPLKQDEMKEFIFYYESENKQSTIILKPYSILNEWGENIFEIKDNKQSLLFKNKIDDWITSYADSNKNVISIIELQDKDSFINSIDPKDILRGVFAKNNRLSQFVTMVEDDRIESGFLDLLRQIDVIPKDIASLAGINTAHVGLHIVKKQKWKRAVAILTAIIKNKTFINVVGITNGWVPYWEGLLLMGQTDKHPSSEKIDVDIYQALKQLEHIIGVKEIIIYAEAINCREVLKWMANTRIHTEGIEIVNGKKISPKNWSFIRLREEETPDWVFHGTEKDEQMNTYDIPQAIRSGLIKYSNRVFYSIAPKLTSTRKMPYWQTRLENDKKPFSRNTAVEICIPHFAESKDPLKLAQITHALRNVSIQYKDYTVSPIPLHLAKKSSEYLLF